MKLLLASHFLYAAALAFKVPSDLPDGNYRVTLPHDDGQDSLIRRHDPVARRWQPVRRGEGFGTGGVSIVVDENADPGEIDSITIDANHDSGKKLPKSKDYTSKACYDKLPFPLDADDYRASKEALFNYCRDYGFFKSHVEMALRGNVLVYVCSTRRSRAGSRKPHFCSREQFGQAEIMMNSTCGDLGAAYVDVRDEWQMQYGRAWRGTEICLDGKGRAHDVLALKKPNKQAFLDEDTGGNHTADGGSYIDYVDDLQAERRRRVDHHGAGHEGVNPGEAAHGDAQRKMEEEMAKIKRLEEQLAKNATVSGGKNATDSGGKEERWCCT